jgi:hypothetical protein
MTTDELKRRRKVAGLIAVVCALTLVVFHFVIAIGMPVGKACWGGASEVVPTGLRTASAVATFVYLFFASVLVQVGGFRDVGYSETFCCRVTWVLFGLMVLGSVLNWLSRSPLERYIWGPFTVVFAISCLVLARSFKSRGETGPRGGLTEDDQFLSSKIDR